MSLFAQRAAEILEAAESAAARGETCTETTLLIGQDGSLRIIADSDWPLDSLIRHHGARSAYRVTAKAGSARVEGWEGSRRCVLESGRRARFGEELKRLQWLHG